MALALGEAALLLLLTDGEPELDEVHAAVHEVPLKLGGLHHELVVLLVRAEAHHTLDAGPVVPRAIEQHDLAARRQVLHVTLEVPLAALLVRRLLQRDDARATRVEMLREALDRTTLARRITTLEQDHDALARLLRPRLQLQQLDLQAVLLLLVALARHQIRVRIHRLAPAINQHVIRMHRGRAVDQIPRLGQCVAERRHVVR